MTNDKLVVVVQKSSKIDLNQMVTLISVFIFYTFLLEMFEMLLFIYVDSLTKFYGYGFYFPILTNLNNMIIRTIYDFNG